MRDAIDVNWNAPADREAILAFIAALGFTPRDAITWNALSMRAIVARRNEQIVGVLPIETRPVQLAGGVTVLAAHQTCVAVVPELRGGGIGSRMQARLTELLPEDVEYISVYREEPTSRAYAWYRTAGFEPAMHIRSWTRAVPDAAPRADASGWTKPLSHTALQDLWSAAREHVGCVVDQTRRPLTFWLSVHPYRARYTLDVVPLGERAYAVVGVGQLHADAPRLDVLDLIAPDVADARELLQRCVALAGERGAREIRIALAERDPTSGLAREIGMTAGWTFDLLVKPLGTALRTHRDAWRYASIDFI